MKYLHTLFSKYDVGRGENKWQMKTSCTAQFLRNAKQIKP